MDIRMSAAMWSRSGNAELDAGNPSHVVLPQLLTERGFSPEGMLFRHRPRETLISPEKSCPQTLFHICSRRLWTPRIHRIVIEGLPPVGLPAPELLDHVHDSMNDFLNQDDRLRRALAQVQLVTEENERICTELVKVKNQHEDASIKIVTAARLEKEASEREIRKLRRERNLLDERLSRLTQEFEEEKRRVSELKTERDNLQREVLRISDDRRRFKRETCLLNEKVDRFETELTHLQNEKEMSLKSLQTERDEAFKDLQSWKEANDDLKSQMKQIRDQLELAKGELERFRQERTAVVDAVSRLQDVRERWRLA
jgi:chromosome segregation ATPase